ncbi:hypothetical protein HBI70_026700 [Parastagonospora nodorum]|nr:hypothetical protein HBI10_107750 [Parastagonospora nodorum]KAH4022347.1 hypothetical protein HBI13_101450 [Parastagonospora nodorum]KAH4027645.1 hypothetical protein HBI09_141380 [Parastagonospora nodorum]KAH4121317.1 hypothetical protein HBH47_101880 [Parastagonospora nodorum]KAH4194151.1 hypothetical protein HBH42_093550 [Parastagonospora nodorum]
MSSTYHTVSEFNISTSESAAHVISVDIKDYKDDHETTWCKVIDANIENPAITRPQFLDHIATARAYIIDRWAMGEAECDWVDMDELSQEAGELFKSKVFYDEITMEPFVLFHEVRVAHEYWIQGLGRDIVKAVLKKAHESLGGAFWVIVAPGHLGMEVAQELMRSGSTWVDEDKVFEIQGRQLDAAQAFWKAVGVAPIKGTQFYYGFVKGDGKVDKRIQ